MQNINISADHNETHVDLPSEIHAENILAVVMNESELAYGCFGLDSKSLAYLEENLHKIKSTTIS